MVHNACSWCIKWCINCSKLKLKESLAADTLITHYRIVSKIGAGGLGELDRAFVLLEQAYERREGILVLLKHNAPFLPGLSADPRLTNLLRRTGLPE